MVPFVIGAVEHGHAADAELADVGREGCLGADGAEEGGPAGSDRGGV